MNLSFSKEINEGDIIIVSLCSYYTEIESKITANGNHHFELVSIDIMRNNALTSVPMNALGDICKTLVKIFDDTPDAVAYYFCDYASDVPSKRYRDGETGQGYRNKLFKLLFQRFSKESGEKWEEREIIIENIDTGNLYAHLIYRDRHKDIIDALVSEILIDSDEILSQK